MTKSNMILNLESLGTKMAKLQEVSPHGATHLTLGAFLTPLK